MLKRRRPYRTLLHLERLEDRTVPAYSASLSGLTATFSGNSSGGSGDIVVFGQSGGLLIHNRGIIDAGFNSAFDFNSNVAGDQTLAASASSVINLTTGSGPDLILIGGQISTGFPAVGASTLLADFNLTKGGAGNANVIIDDSISTTGKTFTFASNGVTATGVNVSFAGPAFGGGIELQTGSGNDTVNLTSVLGINIGAEPRRVTNTGGNDTVTIGSAAGSLDGFAGQPITVTGEAGTTAVTVNDSADAGSDAYTINATDVRREDGANDVVIIPSGVGVSISLKSGGGNDTFNVAPRSNQAINIDGGAGTNSLVIDLAGTTNPVHTPTSATSGHTTYDNRKDVDYQNIQSFSGINGTFTIGNPSPTNLNLFIQANFDENSNAGLLGGFDNLDGEAHTVTIDFGDGSAPLVLNLPAGEDSFQVEHFYFDDNPSGTSADIKTVTVTVSDGVNSLTGTRNTLIHNVAPSNANVTATPTSAGSASTITVTFDDPGTLDPHLLNVNFGDGQSQNIGVAPGQTSSTFTHTYANPGSFSISVVVNDDDLGSSPLVQTTVSVADPVPVVTPPPNQGTDEGQSATFLLGAFTDANNSGNYTVTVNWGDGTPDTIFNQAAAGNITLQDHAFAQDGVFTVTITVGDVDGTSVPATFTHFVSNVLPVRTPPATQSALAGISQLFDLGSFVDPGSDAPWGVVVNWGDGTPNTTFLVNIPGAIPAQSHTYPTNGTFTMIVNVSDDDGTQATTSIVNVANPIPVITAPVPQASTEGVSTSFLLGAFTDVNNSGNYTVTVNWGDGTPNTVFNQATTGAVTFQNHTFAQDGNFTVTVTVADVDGASSPVSFQASISNVLPTAVDAVDQNAVATIAKTFELGSFSDPGADAPWTITVNWGDGSPNGNFTVNTPGVLPTLTHAFATAGTFNVVVTVHDDDGFGTSDYLVTVIPPEAHVLGNVFRDFNRDGSFNTTDRGQSDVVVFADRDGDGVLDANEPTATTDLQGNYDLTVGFEGAVQVRQVVPEGFTQTTSDPASVNVNFGDTFSVEALGLGRIVKPVVAVAGRTGNQPFVQVRDVDGTLRFSFTPYATVKTALKDVRLATGDVNDDGIEDIFVVPGPGIAGAISIFSGADGQLLRVFAAFSFPYTRGLSVAAGDVNGDGVADVWVGTDPGAGPVVRVFDGATTNLLRSFAPANATQASGVRVAAGDVNGDGVIDIITTPGLGNATNRIRVMAFDAFSGSILQNYVVAKSGSNAAQIGITAGDLDGDGRAETLINFTKNGRSELMTFSDGVPTSTSVWKGSAVQVAAKDLNGDGIADLLFAGSAGQLPRIALKDGSSGLTLLNALILSSTQKKGLVIA